MKYSWKGHKDRNTHKKRIKRCRQAQLAYVEGMHYNIPTIWRWARHDVWNKLTLWDRNKNTLLVQIMNHMPVIETHPLYSEMSILACTLFKFETALRKSHRSGTFPQPSLFIIYLSFFFFFLGGELYWKKKQTKTTTTKPALQRNHLTYDNPMHPQATLAARSPDSPLTNKQKTIKFFIRGSARPSIAKKQLP